MTDEVFWELAGTLDGVVDEDGADLLGERLSSLGAEEVEAFCAHLAAKARADRTASGGASGPRRQ